MKLACVYLIGVGPGDPDLISVRALRHLKTADVIVYDSLIHRRLLQSTHPEAEQIDVSSTVSGSLKQDEINLLLVKKFHEGKTVARLKLGDPFIFGSGWQEALFLEEQGVPFEVIPVSLCPLEHRVTQAFLSLTLTPEMRFSFCVVLKAKLPPSRK